MYNPYILDTRWCKLLLIKSSTFWSSRIHMWNIKVLWNQLYRVINNRFRVAVHRCTCRCTRRTRFFIIQNYYLHFFICRLFFLITTICKCTGYLSEKSVVNFWRKILKRVFCLFINKDTIKFKTVNLFTMYLTTWVLISIPHLIH